MTIKKKLQKAFPELHEDINVAYKNGGVASVVRFLLDEGENSRTKKTNKDNNKVIVENYEVYFLNEEDNDFFSLNGKINEADEVSSYVLNAAARQYGIDINDYTFYKIVEI